MWLFADPAFVTPSYSADIFYRPLILLGGFSVGAVLGRETGTRLFRAGSELLALLALIGLLQFFVGFWHLSYNPLRAAATFITPNTFATAINLFLLPLIALAAVGRTDWRAFALMLWLFAGLLSTESRGGWFAFVAGLGFIAIYIDLPRAREAWEPCKRVLAGLLWVIIVFWLATRLEPAATLAALVGTDTNASGIATDTFGATVLSRGTSFRAEIYLAALDLIVANPVVGYGANMFRILFEARKPPEMDIGMTFPFVHNDYLQIWLEFGLPGLILLGATIAAALALIARARREDRHDPLPLACGAAATGMFTHAIVDFPLYIPFLLMTLGLWLGALAAHGGCSERLAPLIVRATDRVRLLCTPLITGALVVAALGWLAQPVLAEITAQRALSDLTAGRVDGALYWQSVARRLEPRNAAHYWAEGVIWRDQAIETNDKSLAARADRLFADGMRSDPYQIANFLERARLHRTHAELFDRPAGAQEMLAWTGEALRLRPYSLVAQAEHARALSYAGHGADAQRIVRAMVERHPEADMARGLSIEFGLQRPAENVR